MTSEYAPKGGEGSLAEFLRSRRSRLTPQDVNLPPGRRRRTLGLRREEVANLAGIGSSWYTALEQGRDVRPSDQVLHSLARALRLTPAETAHLFFLAGRPAPTSVHSPPKSINPALIRLLDRLHPSPSLLSDRKWDWLAWNPAAEILFDFDPAQPAFRRNALWKFFTEEKFAPEREWERSARSMVARFRAQNVLSTAEPWFETFIQDLMAASEDFRRVWQRHDVESATEFDHVMYHRRVGVIHADLVVLETPAVPGAWLLTFLLEPQTAEKLGLSG